MYQLLDNTPRRQDEGEFFQTLSDLLEHNELTCLFSVPPDFLYYRRLSTDAQLYLRFNTASYLINMQLITLDSLIQAIQQHATLEEIYCMLNLPK